MSATRRFGVADLVAFALAAATACSIAAFAMHPSAVRQFVSMGLFLLLLPGALFWLARAVRHWSRLRMWGLLAPALLVAAIPLGLEVGQGLRSWRFERDLPRYQALANWALRRAVAGESVRVPVPPEAGDLAHVIWVGDRPGCGKIVDFYWGLGFPVKHTVRRYVEIPAMIEDDACRGDWARGIRRAEHWFEASD
ncbi:hypothetical protein J5226_19810 [Lysobacter sp. K5869]|uniref:hypothetical protein n=1 Tax=Lysobacter sp. K5869 TaxID=2820808 RepID=UPI001C060CBC|nr:hypothetical protein [Lysobacter sp. K5869]QWP75832.1 hypothetical protein J5226_19810 [Lysobacter sp. K5869]